MPDHREREVTPWEDRAQIRQEVGSRGGHLARAATVLEESMGAGGHGPAEVPPMPESLQRRIREQYGPPATRRRRRTRHRVSEKLRGLLAPPPWLLGGLAAACVAIGAVALLAPFQERDMVRGSGTADGAAVLVILVGDADVPGLNPAAARRVADQDALARELARSRAQARIVVSPGGAITGYAPGDSGPSVRLDPGEHPDGVTDAVLDLTERLR